MATNDGFVTENGMEFLARLSSRSTRLEFVDRFIFPLRFGDTTEILGEPSSGKSQLLLNLISQAILPVNVRDIVVGGSCVEVLLITCLCNIDLMRLISILESRINKAMVEISSLHKNTISTLTPGNIESCIEESLSRLNICSCMSFTQLIATLKSFDEVLCKNNRIRLLMVEMSSLFPWPLEAEAGDNHSKLTFLRMTKCLTQRYKLATFVTNTEVTCASKKPLKDLLRIFSSRISKEFDVRIQCSSSNDCIRLREENGNLRLFNVTSQGLVPK